MEAGVIIHVAIHLDTHHCIRYVSTIYCYLGHCTALHCTNQIKNHLRFCSWSWCLLLTESVLPRPMQCARIQPAPLCFSFLYLSMDSMRLSHMNSTASDRNKGASTEGKHKFGTTSNNAGTTFIKSTDGKLKNVHLTFLLLPSTWCGLSFLMSLLLTCTNGFLVPSSNASTSLVVTGCLVLESISSTFSCYTTHGDKLIIAFHINVHHFLYCDNAERKGTWVWMNTFSCSFFTLSLLSFSAFAAATVSLVSFLEVINFRMSFLPCLLELSCKANTNQDYNMSVWPKSMKQVEEAAQIWATTLCFF